MNEHKTNRDDRFVSPLTPNHRLTLFGAMVYPIGERKFTDIQIATHQAN